MKEWKKERKKEKIIFADFINTTCTFHRQPKLWTETLEASETM